MIASFIKLPDDSAPVYAQIVGAYEQDMATSEIEIYKDLAPLINAAIKKFGSYEAAELQTQAQLNLVQIELSSRKNALDKH